MRILHIGDLHFKKRSKYDQARLVEAFIATFKNNNDINFIFFSGDLVNNGTNKNDFKDAHDFIFIPLLTELGLDASNLFICAGNHDIDRTVIINSLISHFSSKQNLEKKYLDNWFNKQIADKNASLQSNKNFFEYLQNNFIYTRTDIIDPLFSIHVRKIDEKSIGIVTMNSSWFCSGEREDKGELIIMPSLLEEAINKIKHCDLKILMQHHPLNYFKQTISYEIEDLVHSNFNILLVGHVHKEFLETQFRCNNGIYCNTTKASLSDDGGDDDRGEIGYSILNIEMSDLSTIQVDRFHYAKSENTFLPLEPVIITIPLGEAKHKQNEIRKKIKSKFTLELSEANKLLLDYDETNDRIFLDNFTNPILSRDSDEETSIGDTLNKMPFDELLKMESNFLLFGRDKSGKTSLLKKIQLDFLVKYSTKSSIPLYLDYKQIESSDNNFDSTKILSTYYQITRAEAQSLIDDGRLLLLIDNLNTTSSLHTQIIEFLSKNLNVKFIICSEYLTSRIFAEELGGLEYKKYFFKNLSRNEISLYTKKNPRIKEDDKELIVEKVTNFCKQLHLPLSYWTISLILLIYKKSNDDYSKNLYGVLDACVDEILIKKKFLFEKTNLKFEQYKSLCAEIAYRLYKKYSEDEYSCSYQNLLLIVEDYRMKNPRVVITGNEILEFLFNCGILKHKPDNLCTFRLNGIFEYFLAYYIKENDVFKREIIDSSTMYLSFKNELEIYSGFNRNDIKFLKEIFKKTQLALEPFKLRYLESLDKTLMNKISDAYNFDKSVKGLIVTSPLTDEKKNLIFDKVDVLDIDSDVHLKPVISGENLNVEVVEKYITILSRVLKNSDSVTDPVLVYEIFDYLLDTYCQFGFYIIDEYEESAKQENIKAREDFEIEDDIVIGEEMLKLLSKILPVLVEAMMYDGLGQENFTKIIEDKIRDCRLNVDKNQYKLFVLYFLLIDIDLKTNKGIIDDVFEDVTLSPLKVATLFKLNFYLAFKAYKNNQLETFIKNKMQQASIRLDSKIDIGGFQKSLSNASKRNLIKKIKK